MGSATDRPRGSPLASSITLVVVSGVAALVLALMFMSYRTVLRHVEEDPAFCGRCHASRSQFLLWTGSAHKRVACQLCHPMDQDKAVALLQAFVRYTGEPGPDGLVAPMHTLPVPQHTCVRCHIEETADWPQIRDSVGHKVHLRAPRVGCLDCHARAIHRFDRAEESCARCHAEQVDGEGGMSQLHCNACHDFHANAALIPTRALCRECHLANKVNLGRFPDNVHMARLSCSACHQPHKRERVDRAACLRCHEQIARHGLHDKAEHGNCSDCHRAHDWRPQVADCVGCHAQRSARCQPDRCWSCHPMTYIPDRRRSP